MAGLAYKTAGFRFNCNSSVWIKKCFRAPRRIIILWATVLLVEGYRLRTGLFYGSINYWFLKKKVAVCTLLAVLFQGMTTYDIRCTKGLDIRLISLISGCRIRLKRGCFHRLFKIFTLWQLSTDISLIFRYIQQISFNILLKSVRYVFNWNLINFLLISIYYTSDIWLISLISWNPV